MTFESEGSIAIELIARFGSRSSSALHESPASVDFHTPPATPAAYMISGVFGSIKIERVRPPMLPGPSWTHWLNSASIENPPLARNREATAVEYEGMRRI